jgi:hypothetical protein
LLLSGRKFDDFTPELKQKSKLLGLDQWLDAIPRNLKILLDTYNEKDTHPLSSFVKEKFPDYWEEAVENSGSKTD